MQSSGEIWHVTWKICIFLIDWGCKICVNFGWKLICYAIAKKNQVWQIILYICVMYEALSTTIFCMNGMWTRLA